MAYDLPSLKFSGQPSSIAPPADDPKWYLDWGKFIMSQWWAGRCTTRPYEHNGSPALGLSHSEETIDTLRAYGRGSQDVRKYKMTLDKEIKSKQGITGGLMNISWRPPQVYTTMRERIIDKVLEFVYEPYVVAIDDSSVERKNLAFLRDKVAASPMGKSLTASTGVQPSNVSPAASEMSESDIDTLKALGGYNLATEIALTEAIMSTIDICAFNPTVRRQIIEDILDIGIGHAHIRHNAATKMQEIEYIDPANAIIPTTQYDDARDATWGGFLRPMSISALRAELRACGSEYTEEDLLKIAKTYRSKMGNTDAYASGQIGARDNYGIGFVYDPMQVMVATCYFVAAQTESFIAGVHDSGSKVFKAVPDKSSLKDSSKDKGFSMVRSVVQNVYKVNYVIGTDFCYGYGMDDLIVRDGLPGSMSAMIPIVTYRLNRKSLTEACISAIDDLCNAVYKKRHIIATMPAPPNISVNLSALERTTQLGTMSLTPEDILDVYTIRGVLFTSDGEYEEFQNGTPPRPISELPNTAYDQLRTIQIGIDAAMSELIEITGANNIDTGQANPTNVMSATVNAYTQSSNRALSFVFTANQSIQQSLNLQLGRRYQAIAASGGATLKWVPVRTDVVKIIQLTPDIAFGEFTIISKAGIGQEHRQVLINAIATYKQSSSLDAADEMVVMNMVLKGEYQKAQFYLVAAVNKKRAMDARITQENMAAQAQAQGDAAVRIEQAKQQSEAMKMEGAAKLMQLEYSLKTELVKTESQYSNVNTSTI